MAAAARREVVAQSGTAASGNVERRVAIDVGVALVGVPLFVVTGTVRSRQVHGSPEGTPEWIGLARLDAVPLVAEPPPLPGIVAARGSTTAGRVTMPRDDDRRWGGSSA